MKYQNRPLSAFLLFTLATLALAAVDGLTVKRTVKAGQVYKLKLKGDLDVGGNQATVFATNVAKVTKVDADGSYTIETTRTEGKVTVNGQDQDIPDTPTETAVYNPDGSVKEVKSEDSSATAAAYRMANLQALVDPGKPLNVGDTWSATFKADSKTGAEAGRAEYKILAEEKVGDVDTIKVQVKAKETSAAEPASSEGTEWISKADGSLVKAEVTWTNAPVSGSPAPVSGKIVLTQG